MEKRMQGIGAEKGEGDLISIRFKGGSLAQAGGKEDNWPVERKAVASGWGRRGGECLKAGCARLGSDFGGVLEGRRKEGSSVERGGSRRATGPANGQLLPMSMVWEREPLGGSPSGSVWDMEAGTTSATAALARGEAVVVVVQEAATGWLAAAPLAPRDRQGLLQRRQGPTPILPDPVGSLLGSR